MYVYAVKVYKNKYPVNLRGGGATHPVLDRIVTSMGNPSDYCSVCKNLLFDVLQRTSPYTSPRGRVVPGCLVLEQKVPLTVGTPIWVSGEDSVHRQSGIKQQSGGWV